MLPELLTWKLSVKYLKNKSSRKKKQKSISMWGMIFFHYKKHDTDKKNCFSASEYHTSILLVSEKLQIKN